MRYLKKLFLFFGMILLIGNTVLESKTLAAYYENDITPPWGRVHVEKSAKIDGTTYVGETPVNVKIYAKDDMCLDEEIKYYISTEPISNTSKLDTWYDYAEGKTHEINLNDDGTGKVYTIFKDATGNTSITYEANANTAQEVIFDINGGQGEIQGVEKDRIYGMPYIVPIQMPYKNGYTFLGWSTDKEANVGSYRQGDAIPADISLGTEESVTLYAIYGVDLDTLPDLVDVVEIGDYVNYPVYYDNVVTHSYNIISKLNGWRVLSKDKETGEITIISAGVPLSLYKSTATTASSIAAKMASTTNFLNISFSSTSTDGKFVSNGFAGYNTLKDAFTNKFTIINSEIPEVRSMTKGDVDNIYQYFGGNGTTGLSTPVYDTKYRDMLAIPGTGEYWCFYWLASYEDSRNLYDLRGVVGEIYSGFDAVLGVRPVVTLKPNIKAVGKDINGAWDIEI